MAVSLKRDLDLLDSEERDSISQLLKFRADVFAQSSEDKIAMLKKLLTPVSQTFLLIANQQKRLADWTVVLLVADIMNLSHHCQYDKLPAPNPAKCQSPAAQKIFKYTQGAAACRRSSAGTWS